MPEFDLTPSFPPIHPILNCSLLPGYLPFANVLVLYEHQFYNVVSSFAPWLLPFQDGNGYIDRRELAIMLKFLGEPMTEEEISAIIEEADVDKDGVIDYAEFFTMMGTLST